MRVIPSNNHLRSIISHASQWRVRGTYLPVCFNISSIFVWKTWSTDSTVTVVPDWGIAKTSTHEIWMSAYLTWVRKWTDGIIINEFSQHQTHDFHRYTRSTMFEHLSSATIPPIGVEGRTFNRAREEIWTVSPLGISSYSFETTGLSLLIREDGFSRLHLSTTSTSIL